MRQAFRRACTFVCVHKFKAEKIQDRKRLVFILHTPFKKEKFHCAIFVLKKVQSMKYDLSKVKVD